VSGALNTVSRKAIPWLVGLTLLTALDRGLKAYYYSKTYRYYDAGEVYWEDSHTLLLFSPDRHLFWRLKPDIRMKLEETPETYDAYRVGTRPAPYAFEVRTDGRGFNSPDFDCAAKGDSFRIATLGDSRTMAEGVPFEQLYPRKLELLLRRGRGGRPEVINGGVSGYSSHQGLVQLERDLLPCRPDVVTVLFGINDQDRDQGVTDREKARYFDSPLTTLRAWSNRSMIVYFLRREWWQLRGWWFGKTPARPVAYPSQGPQAARVPLDDYRRNLERIAELGRAHGFTPVFLILPTSPYAYYPDLFPDQLALSPADARTLDELEAQSAEDPEGVAKRLRQMRDEGRESSRVLYLLAQCLQRLGRFDEAHALFVEANRSIVFSRYEAVVRATAAAQRVPLLDLNADFNTLRPEALYVDDMHPNARGHELIARRLYELLGEASVRRQ
jgi:lysophospholipase L1-like esterase